MPDHPAFLTLARRLGHGITDRPEGTADIAVSALTSELRGDSFRPVRLWRAATKRVAAIFGRGGHPASGAARTRSFRRRAERH